MRVQSEGSFGFEKVRIDADRKSKGKGSDAQSCTGVLFRRRLVIFGERKEFIKA